MANQSITQNNSTSTANSENFTLKQVSTIKTKCRLNTPFCLQSSNEFIIVKGFDKLIMSRFERRICHQELAMNISTQLFDSSNFTVLSSVKINEEKVFNSATHLEKNNIMLNPDLLPQCIPPSSQQLKRSLISPYSNESQPVLANLSMNGALELLEYVFDTDDNTAAFESFKQLSEMRKDEENIAEPIAKLPKLIEIHNKLSFIDFVWCPELENSKTIKLAALTKSRELQFYTINNRIVTKDFSHQLDSSVLAIKWITSIKSRHYLLTVEKKGNLTLHRIDTDNQHKITGVKMINEIFGELNIAASEVVHETIDSKLLLVTCKAHSIEAFLLSDKQVKSVKEYIGLSVTGIAKVCNEKPAYMISTLDGKIHYVEFAVNKNDLKIISHQKVESDVSDPSITPYAIYGISASRNKNFIYLALYPSVAHDHLEIRNPGCLAIFSFTRVDPVKILLTNPARSLLGFHDCVEHVRNLGFQDMKNLKSFEDFGDVSVDDDSIYRLKLSLIAVKTNESICKMKSAEEYVISKRVVVDTMNLISCLNTLKLLRNVKHTKDNVHQVQSMRRCVRRYLSAQIEDEKFKHVKEKLTPIIEKELSLLDRKLGKCPPELCLICLKAVDELSLTCGFKHKLSRCMITHQQLPITNNNYCCYCFHPSAGREMIEKITDTKVCIFCDRFIVFQD